VVNDYSLMYTWPGSDPALKPVVFLAHMDVVPVDAGSAQLWTHDPFSGTVADGRVWGRGALDDKSSVMAILETAETLLRDGWAPKRTMYFCFGHDEELGGPKGAGAMAALLKERGVKAWFSMDEGSGIADGILPGIEGPVALVATCEKGYVSLKLEVEGKGGHSSKPPANTSLGLLCAAIARLEAQQFEPAIEGPIREMLDVAGREMAFPLNVVMANMWLTEPLLINQLANSDTTRAALRTTTAPTILNAGTKENVLPIKAEAVVNFRIYPGDTVADVLAHAPVSDTASDSFQLLAQSIRNVHPTYPVAPAMSIGGTDSKHFYEVAENCYRFQPMVFKQSDFDTIHGTDESCSIEVFLNGIQLYAEIIRNAAG
jgi:carboxypeptidase PM20D1